MTKNYRPAATYSSKKAVMSTGSDGLNQITEEFLAALCEENEQYVTPHLNDQLFLHFKGFKKIEKLEKYYNLKTLWLESNGIKMMTGLAHLTKLRMLYLQQNMISKIEGLDTCKALVRINLSNNQLKHVGDGLKCLENLQNLDLSKNLFESML
jgi:dynein assembly factor 1